MDALHCQVGLASGRSLARDCIETLSWSSSRALDRPTPQRPWICSCQPLETRQAILWGHGGATRWPELATRWRRRRQRYNGLWHCNSLTESQLPVLRVKKLKLVYTARWSYGYDGRLKIFVIILTTDNRLSRPDAGQTLATTTQRQLATADIRPGLTPVVRSRRRSCTARTT